MSSSNSISPFSSIGSNYSSMSDDLIILRDDDLRDFDHRMQNGTPSDSSSDMRNEQRDQSDDSAADSINEISKDHIPPYESSSSEDSARADVLESTTTDKTNLRPISTGIGAAGNAGYKIGKIALAGKGLASGGKIGAKEAFKQTAKRGFSKTCIIATIGVFVVESAVHCNQYRKREITSEQLKRNIKGNVVNTAVSSASGVAGSTVGAAIGVIGGPVGIAVGAALGGIISGVIGSIFSRRLEEKIFDP